MNNYILPLILGLLGSGGLFTLIQFLIQRKDSKTLQREKLEKEKKEAEEKELRDNLRRLLDSQEIQSEMLMALGHDKICELGYKYVARGYVTVSELTSLELMLTPYEALGGDGEVHIVMDLVRQLPKRSNS